MGCFIGDGKRREADGKGREGKRMGKGRGSTISPTHTFRHAGFSCLELKEMVQMGVSITRYTVVCAKKRCTYVGYKLVFPIL